VPGHDGHAHGVVGGLLLDVGEAGDRAPVDEVGAVGELDVDQRADTVAERRGRLLGFVEAPQRGLQVGVVAEAEHRRLPAADDDRVVLVEVEVGQARGVAQAGRLLLGAQVAEAEDVLGGVARLVAWIAHAVDLDLAAVGAGDGHVVAGLGELVEGMEELGGPEAHRPSGRGRGGRVGDDHQDALGLRGRPIQCGGHATRHY
jgi:hypothetical protein